LSGLVFILALLVAIAYALFEEKKYQIKDGTIILYVLFALPAGIIFGRLLYLLFKWDNFSLDPFDALRVWYGGYMLHGALLGCVLTALIFCRTKKISFGNFMDALCVPALILIAVKRWADYFNQESFGPPVDDSRMKFFPLSVYIERIEAWRMALFFIEFLACVIFAVVISICAKKGLFKRVGDKAIWSLLLYNLFRSCIEIKRIDLIMWGHVPFTLCLSFIIVIAIFVFFIVSAHKKNKKIIVEIISCFVALIAMAVGIYSVFLYSETKIIFTLLIISVMVCYLLLCLFIYRRIPKVESITDSHHHDSKVV